MNNCRDSVRSHYGLILDNSGEDEESGNIEYIWELKLKRRVINGFWERGSRRRKT